MTSLGDIQSRRRDILAEILSTLSKLLDLYHGSHRLCRKNPDCDALALGKLMKGLKDTGLYPIPEPSSIRDSIDALFVTIRSIELSSLCSNLRKKSQYGHPLIDRVETYDYYSDEVVYHLDEELRDSLLTIEGKVGGMEL